MRRSGPRFRSLFLLAGQAKAVDCFNHMVVVPIVGVNVTGYIHVHIRQISLFHISVQSLIDPLDGLAALDIPPGLKEISLTVFDPAPIAGTDNQALRPVARNVRIGTVRIHNTVRCVKSGTNHRKFCAGHRLTRPESTVPVSVQNSGLHQRGNGGVGPPVRTHIEKAVLFRQAGGTILLGHQSVKNCCGFLAGYVVLRPDRPIFITENVRCSVR